MIQKIKYLTIFLVILFFLPGSVTYSNEDITSILSENINENITRGGATIGDFSINENFTKVSKKDIPFATLDILEFAPLSNVDYGGGIIITDWYSSDSNIDKSIKISIQFLSDEIRADGLVVKIYQKNCISNSNCSVKLTETDLNQEIKLAILKKAALIKRNDIKKTRKEKGEVIIPKNSKDRKTKKK